MKKFFAAIALIAIATIAAHAAVIQPIGPVTCKWTVLSQGLNFQLTAAKTNATATVTNVTATYKSTVNKTNFNTGDLLTLVENSLNTNFPAGSQIALRVSQFFVVDATGTNILFDLSDLVGIQFGLFLDADVRNQKMVTTSSGTAFSGTDASVATINATLNYGDSAFTTADGTHTTFALHGLMTIIGSNTFAAGTKVVNNIVFQTAGDGTLRNLPVIINGTMNSKGKAILSGF